MAECSFNYDDRGKPNFSLTNHAAERAELSSMLNDTVARNRGGS